MLSKNRRLKLFAGLLIAGFIVFASVLAFMWFKPHRDVAKTAAFETLTVRQLTKQFEIDASAANAKYLADNGNSKVLIVEGVISKMSRTQTGELLLLLRDPDMKAGVQARFSPGIAEPEGMQAGQTVRIKGSIAAGNRYDADLDLHEHALLVDSNFEPK